MTDDADDTTATDAQDTTPRETAEVSIHYTRMTPGDGVEPGGEAFEQARDIRTFGDVDLVDAAALATCYTHLGTATVDLSNADVDPSDTDALLEHLYRRLQGPRRDATLPYNGHETRSAMVGDVIVVDGTAHMVARIDFEEIGPAADLGIDPTLDDGDDGDEADDEPTALPDGGRPRDDGTRTCARCDDPAQPGSRFCTAHGRISHDGGGA